VAEQAAAELLEKARIHAPQVRRCAAENFVETPVVAGEEAE
jgi:hypothetical protein